MATANKPKKNTNQPTAMTFFNCLSELLFPERSG